MEAGGGQAGGATIHKSSHPSLPPAQPEQVVQFLLARNYHLTCLELLVESQQTGHGDEVVDLQAFFADKERFPPDELAKYQHSNALEQQSVGRERERRLQMAEYELRLAKEDLAEATRRLEQAQQAAAAASPQETSSGVTPLQVPAAAANDGVPDLGPGSAPLASISGGSGVAGWQALLAQPSAPPSLAEEQAMSRAVLAHLLLRGLKTTAITLQEELGSSLLPVASPRTSSAGQQQQDDIWAWFSAARVAAVLAATASGAAGDGGPAGAVAATDDGASDIAASAANGAAQQLGAKPAVPALPPQSGEEDAEDDEARSVVSAMSGATPRSNGEVPLARVPSGASQASTDGGRVRALQAQLAAAQQQAAELRAQVADLRSCLVAVEEAASGAGGASRRSSVGGNGSPSVTGRRLADVAAAAASAMAAVGMVSSASTPAPALRASAAGGGAQSMDSTDALADLLGPMAALLPPISAPSAGGAHSHLAPASSLAELLASPHAGSVTGSLPSFSGYHHLLTASRLSGGNSMGAGAAQVLSPAASASNERLAWLHRGGGMPVDPSQQAALQGLLVLVSGLCPRLVPNLTLKSRVEALPLMQAVARASPDPEVRRSMLATTVNLVPSPDDAQRQAIVSSCVSLAQGFGPGWAAVELLPLCVKQASSASAERRALVAELLGAAVGVVEVSTQAHVLLTQLHALAKDRTELVRAAALASLTALLRAMAYARAYYQPLEELTLLLLRDGAEAVASGALGALLPAFLAWLPAGQEGADLLTSSLMPKVVMETLQQLRACRAGAGAGGSAAASPAGGVQYSGAMLSYSLSPQPPSPPGAAAGAAHGYGGGGGGAPGRRFPSLEQQLAHEMLAAYMALLPALRAAALHSAPIWARDPTATSAAPLAGAHHRRTASHPAQSPFLDTPPAETPHSAQHHHHHHHHSLHAPSAAASPFSLLAAATPTSPTSGDDGREPVTPLPRMASLPHVGLDGSPGTAAPASADGAAAAAADGRQHGEAATPQASSSQAAAAPGEQAGGRAQQQQQRDEDDAIFSRWAWSPQHMQWKAMQWVVQYLVPELVEALRCVQLPGMVPVVGGASASAAAGAPPLLVPQAHASELALQLARAVEATCMAFGRPFCRGVLAPVFASAAGVLNTAGGAPSPAAEWCGQPTKVLSAHVLEACADAMPRGPDAVAQARRHVLPMLLGSVLPGCGMLLPRLSEAMADAHKPQHGWLLEAQEDVACSLSFACELTPQRVGELLHLLEALLLMPGPGPGPVPATPAAAASSAAAVSSSAAGGLCAVCVARALVPHTTSEQLTRRLLPALMALLSRGEAAVQSACVGALAALAATRRDDGKVVEQVFVVFDGLLAQAPHDVQMAVLVAGLQMAESAAPTASVSAAAAQQVEWLLQATQALASQLASAAAAAAAAPAGGRTPEQQRALATQLLAITRAVATWDLKLPRLQSGLAAAMEAGQKLKGLAAEPPAPSTASSLLSGFMGRDKERPAGQAALPAVSSSASLSAPAAAGASTPTGAADGGGGAAADSNAPSSAASSMGGAPPAGAPSGNIRSRFDAFKQRLTRRKDGTPDSGLPSGGGAGGMPAVPPRSASSTGPVPTPGSGLTPPGSGASALLGLSYGNLGARLSTGPAHGTALQAAALQKAKDSNFSFFSDDEGD